MDLPKNQAMQITRAERSDIVVLPQIVVEVTGHLETRLVAFINGFVSVRIKALASCPADSILENDNTRKTARQ